MLATREYNRSVAALGDRLGGRTRFIIFHAVLICAVVALFLVISALGDSLPRPAGGQAAHLSAAPVLSSGLLAKLLIALATIMTTVLLFGQLARRIGQPAVIGEMTAGIFLGPSFLGAFWPRAGTFLISPDVMPHLAALAEIGIILFMFRVGLHLNWDRLRERAGTAVAISVQGFAIPFICGVALALQMYPVHAPENVSFTVFALFVGAAMSVTAFPVLARIVADQGLAESPLGVVALAAAAVGDVLAWCALALAVGVAAGTTGGVLLTLGLTTAYVAVMLLAVRPAIRWIGRKVGDRSPGVALTGAVLVMMLLSALATDSIGIHPVFGAFLFGVLFRHDGNLAGELGRAIDSIALSLLLPVFFVYSGLRTDIGLMDGGAEWLTFAMIIAVAVAGKFGGTFFSSMRNGFGPHDAARMGILMNTRGMVELTLLNIGLDLGIIGRPLFTMMVLMALFTTFLATPALQLIKLAEHASSRRS